MSGLPGSCRQRHGFVDATKTKPTVTARGHFRSELFRSFYDGHVLLVDGLRGCTCCIRVERRNSRAALSVSKQVNRARDMTGVYACLAVLQYADGGVVRSPQILKIVSTAKHPCEAKAAARLRLSRW